MIAHCWGFFCARNTVWVLLHLAFLGFAVVLLTSVLIASLPFVVASLPSLFFIAWFLSIFVAWSFALIFLESKLSVCVYGIPALSHVSMAFENNISILVDLLHLCTGEKCLKNIHALKISTLNPLYTRSQVWPK